MKNNKFNSKISFGVLLVCSMIVIIIGCNKLIGLPLQKDAPYNSQTLNPNTGKTAWDYIKSRGIAGDSIFYLMYQGIKQFGVDTSLYTQPNTTYILYSNAAIYSFTNSTKKGKVSTTVSTSCFFGHYKVDTSGTGKRVAVKGWSYYHGQDSIDVHNHLLYLIIPGLHSFNNIPITYEAFNTIQVPTPFEFETTLMPSGVETTDTTNIISFNQSDSTGNWQSIYLNAFPGSKLYSTTPGLKVSTGGIIATNGVMHSVDKVLYYTH